MTSIRLSVLPRPSAPAIIIVMVGAIALPSPGSASSIRPEAELRYVVVAVWNVRHETNAAEARMNAPPSSARWDGTVP